MLRLMYVTNDVNVAAIADESGVDTIMVDLERCGKRDRQRGWNSLISDHKIEDVIGIKGAVKNANVLVRVNSMGDRAKEEIEKAVSYGADTIMLPYFKTVSEAAEFLECVNSRARTSLLIETKEAVENIDEILSLPGIDEVHIGLNDLSHSYGKKFLFETVADGTVDYIVEKIRRHNILKYGIGGMARIGEGDVPAEDVLYENCRLGSSCVILSRAFCDTKKITDIEEIRRIFDVEVKKIRMAQKTAEAMTRAELDMKHEHFKLLTANVIQQMEA